MTSTTQTAPATSRRSNAAAAILVVIAVLSGVIAVSVYFVTDEPFPDSANLLIATFGAGMAVLATLIAVIPFRRGERWAWAALWVWPAFFVAHVVVLGTWVPDGIFAAATAGALLMSRP